MPNHIYQYHYLQSNSESDGSEEEDDDEVVEPVEKILAKLDDAAQEELKLIELLMTQEALVFGASAALKKVCL